MFDVPFMLMKLDSCASRNFVVSSSSLARCTTATDCFSSPNWTLNSTGRTASPRSCFGSMSTGSNKGLPTSHARSCRFEEIHPKYHSIQHGGHGQHVSHVSCLCSTLRVPEGVRRPSKLRSLVVPSRHPWGSTSNRLELLDTLVLGSHVGQLLQRREFAALDIQPILWSHVSYARYNSFSSRYPACCIFVLRSIRSVLKGSTSLCT